MTKFYRIGKKMRIIIFLIGFIIIGTLTQCTSYDFARRIQQQGNLLPQSKIERLKVGMNKNDVAILMGTSLLSPLFSTNRWDYAYTWRKGNHGSMKIRHVSLYFHGDSLVRIAHHKGS